MTHPSLDDVRSAVNDIPAGANIPVKYCNAVNTLIDLAQSYIEVSGELPMEKECVIHGRAINESCEHCAEPEYFNTCLVLCRLAYLKQAKRVEELVEKGLTNAK